MPAFQVVSKDTVELRKLHVYVGTLSRRVICRMATSLVASAHAGPGWKFGYWRPGKMSNGLEATADSGISAPRSLSKHRCLSPAKTQVGLPTRHGSVTERLFSPDRRGCAGAG
jgi:hypothetical protein